jgi:DNA-directed RNA polymerase specialized sigma24 family protein
MDRCEPALLLRAWRDRQTRPPGLSLKAWLHALLFRAADALARRKGRVRSHEAVSLEDDPVPPSFQPDESTDWEVSSTLASRLPSKQPLPRSSFSERSIHARARLC